MLRLILIALLSLTTLAPAHAEEELGGSSILAIVNDDVISTLDVENRLLMVLATTNLSDTAETRASLSPQILRGLMDERLQAQEAAKNGVTVSDEEVQAAIRDIEQKRGIPEGGFAQHLQEKGVPSSTFTDQVRAQLQWSRLVMRVLKPRVKVTDEEIERERAKVKRASGGGDVRIALVTLPVDKPEHDVQVKALAEKLVAEVRNGASFESVAREMAAGQAESAAPFWVPVEQLDPALSEALQAATVDTLLPPVRTLEGYTLVKLLERRAGTQEPSSINEVVIKDILLKLKSDAGKQDVDLMLSIGREVAKHPGNCSDPGVAGVKDLSGFDISASFRRETLEGLSPQLKDIVGRLPVGGVSEPYATQEGIRLFMLCERVEKPMPLADREEVMQKIFQQKLELEAQKYLRALRREATVDVRTE